MAGVSLDSIASADRDEQAVENARAILYTTACDISPNISRHRKHANRNSLRAGQDKSAQTIDALETIETALEAYE